MNLDDLAAQAATITPAAPDAAGVASAPGAAAAPGPAPESPLEANTRVLCTVLALLREMTASPVIFSPPLTTLRDRLPDDKLPGLVEPWARVLEHYGYTVGGSLEHPLAVALLLTGPTIWGIGQDLRHELAARRAKPVTPDPEPADPAP